MAAAGAAAGAAQDMPKGYQMASGRRAKGEGEATRFRFTRKSVDAARCPAGKSQALYWDTEQPGLGLRVTEGGARSFIFESRLGGRAGQTVRVTIGPASMPIRTAKDKAGRPVTFGADSESARLAGLIAQGIDPRAHKAAAIAAQEAERAAARAARARMEVSALEAWDVYVADRSDRWGKLHALDHERMVSPGGLPRARTRGKRSKRGVLYSLLNRPLAAIDAEAVEQWAGIEAKSRPVLTALAFRLLRAFLNWCAEHPEYRGIVNADACKSRRAREKLPKPAARSDALQREQLRAWFAEVRKLAPVTGAFLQTLLLTGARRDEMAGLRWPDVDFVWKSLRIRDKVEGERVIPLTPYVAAMLRDLKARSETPPTLPRRLRADPEAAERALRKWKASPWVFESSHAKAGRLRDPRSAHVRALQAAGLPHVSIHGLRRSFGTLAEWCEVPVGIVAQIQGHKPSAIAEKHYRVRPLDLLRLWHERIEAWILGEAGVAELKAEGAAPALRAVGA